MGLEASLPREQLAGARLEVIKSAAVIGEVGVLYTASSKLHAQKHPAFLE